MGGGNTKLLSCTGSQKGSGRGNTQEIPGQGLAMAHNHGIGPKSARAAGRPWAPPSPGRKEVSGLEMERETQMLKVHKTVCMLSGETPPSLALLPHLVSTSGLGISLPTPTPTPRARDGHISLCTNSLVRRKDNVMAEGWGDLMKQIAPCPVTSHRNPPLEYLAHGPEFPVHIIKLLS